MLDRAGCFQSIACAGAFAVLLLSAPRAHAAREWTDLGPNTHLGGGRFDTANGAHFATDGVDLLLLESDNSDGVSRFDPATSLYEPLASAPLDVLDGGDFQYAGGEYLATVGNALAPDGNGNGPLLYSYDPASNFWSERDSAKINAIAVATEALAFDPTGGLVYASVVGIGSGGDPAWQESLAIYDPSIDRWLGATAPSGVLFEDGTEAEFLDGRIFVWPGGRIGQTAQDSKLLVYDIASDSWSTTRSLAGSGLSGGWMEGSFDLWGLSLSADSTLNLLFLTGGETNHTLYVYWKPANFWFKASPSPYDGGWGSSLEYVGSDQALYMIDGRSSEGGVQGTAVFAEAVPEPPITDRDLVFHHAPVHYQDSDSDNPVSDYITRMDFDRDWIGTNNWDNLFEPVAVRRGFMYYSIVETCSHWYIVYSAFHPRDWTDAPLDQEHENDLEGHLAIIEKDGTDFGTLQGIITVFHRDFYSYVPPTSPLVAGNETVDGDLSFETHNGIDRPRTAQEAKGHGWKAWPFIEDFDGSEDQDGIIYFPVLSNGASTEPTSGNDREAFYSFVDTFEPNGFWSHQLDDLGKAREEATTFAAWGTFKGDKSGGCGDGLDTCAEDAANAPWGWDDSDDGDSFRGEMGFDPASLADFYFDGVSFSQTYERNQFLEDLQDAGYSSASPPPGWPEQIDLDALFAKLGTCTGGGGS